MHTPTIMKVSFCAPQFSKPATILVVEDHPCLGEVMATVLRRCGYRVLTATNAEQAASIAEEAPAIDLLVATIEIRELSSPEAISWFRAAQPGAEVVFTSNSHRASWPDSSRHVEQPFIHLDTLIRTVRAVLNHPHAAMPTALAA